MIRIPSEGQLAHHAEHPWQVAPVVAPNDLSKQRIGAYIDTVTEVGGEAREEVMQVNTENGGDLDDVVYVPPGSACLQRLHGLRGDPESLGEGGLSDSLRFPDAPKVGRHKLSNVFGYLFRLTKRYRFFIQLSTSLDHFWR